MLAEIEGSGEPVSLAVSLRVPLREGVGAAGLPVGVLVLELDGRALGLALGVFAAGADGASSTGLGNAAAGLVGDAGVFEAAAAGAFDFATPPSAAGFGDALFFLGLEAGEAAAGNRLSVASRTRPASAPVPDCLLSRRTLPDRAAALLSGRACEPRRLTSELAQPNAATHKNMNDNAIRAMMDNRGTQQGCQEREKSLQISAAANLELHGGRTKGIAAC